MDWDELLFSGKGRIGRKNFWTLWVPLSLLGSLLQRFGLVGDLVAVALGFPQICLMSKRFHDIGRSGWYAGLVIVLTFLAAFFGEMSQAMTGEGPVQLTVGIVTVLTALAALGIWLRGGFKRGDPGENRYGPPPGDRLRGRRVAARATDL